MRSWRAAAAGLLILVASIASGCAGRQTAADLSDRAERVAILIERMEQMGARECAPEKLARAKVLLDHALHEMAEGHYPAAWTRKEFHEAEKVTGEMLHRMILATPSGGQCLHPEG